MKIPRKSDKQMEICRCMYSYIDAKIIAPLMQHVKLYTDNLLFWYRDLVHLDSINIPKFDGTNAFFLKFNRHMAICSGRWENPYSASSARRQRSVEVMKAQCTNWERCESAVKALKNRKLELHRNAIERLGDKLFSAKNIKICLRSHGPLEICTTLSQRSGNAAWCDRGFRKVK